MATDKPATDRSRGNLALKIVLMLGANAVILGLVTWWTTALQLGGAYRPGGMSEAAAGFVGMIHMSFGIIAAAMRATARFEPDAEHAEDLRREGRALLLGAVALIAAGLSLIVLSMAGPGRPIAPLSGAVAVLGLNAFALIVGTVRLRKMDELNREMTRDAGRLAFAWLSVIGGTWAVLAHLGFLRAPAPLDWFTLMAGLSFVAGIVALVKRGGFGQP